MKPTLLLGAPGTGKTHSLVQKILQIKPEKFALLSFTKRAANEAKQRLRVYYRESDLKYVRTIHSLCFELLGLRTSQVMDFRHLRQFGAEFGYEFTGRSHNLEDDSYSFLSEDDIDFRKTMMSIAKCDFWTDNPDMFDRYAQFKAKNHLIDFHDMLIKASNEALFRGQTLDLLCVDEIQDLTPLQLNFIRELVIVSKEVIYAGDDNQMIFEWAGVDRGRFAKLAETSDSVVLKENYRIEGEIRNLAHTIINRCADPGYCRIGSTGDTTHNVFTDLASFDTLRESTLILARNGYFLPRIARELDDFGLEYSFLQDEYKPTKVKLSTIHVAKGAEADNVILYSDVSPATFENIDEDKEHRVWYVAVTRAKNKLYIVPPQTDCYYGLY